MLEGLEATIIRRSEVVEGNRDKRLDSQYFRRLALAADKLIAACRPVPISKISHDVRSFGAYALTNEFRYQDQGISFLRGTDYSGNFINFGDALKISPEAHQLLHKSEVLPGMVLFSMSGSVGSVAVALDDWNYPINSNQDIAKIIPKDVLPFYLAAYLSGRFGRIQIDRLPVGSVQQHIFLWMIERLLVPRFSQRFEENVARIASLAYRQNEGVHDGILRAENYLLSSLGLTAWTPPEPLTYLSTFNHVKSAERFDAEFFSPNLDLPIELMKKKKISFISIGEIQTHNTRGIQPEYTETGDVRVVNSRHILDGRLDYDNFETTHSGAWQNNPKARILKNDILIYTTGANIGRTACNQIDSKLIASNHVNVLRISQHNPVYVAFVLNSKIGRMQTARYSGGSAQAELYPKDIGKFMIPIISEVEQETIIDLLNQSEICRQRSKQLLDAAKRTVEIAIEESEAAAMAHLNQAEEKLLDSRYS